MRFDGKTGKEFKLTYENRVNGAMKSAETRRNKKTVAELLKTWADNPVSKEDELKLKELGLGKDLNNRVLLVLPLIENVKKGDVRSLQMALELINEDKKKDLELKKLNEEIALLKAQKEKLEAERLLIGELDEKIIINMDIKKEDGN